MSLTSRSLALIGRSAVNFFRRRPFCVSFEITYSCNARCRHCHLGGFVREERASPERFGEIAGRIRPVVAQVSGGEPLLRPDVERVIQALRRSRRDPFIILTTNGTLLTKEKYLRLREAGVDEISLSLDYPDERHDEFRGVRGLFGKIRDLALDLSGREKPGITLSCVIHRDNYRDLLKLAELARRWRMKLNFSAYTFLRTQRKDLMVPAGEMEELKQILSRILEFKKQSATIVTSDYVLRKIPEYFEAGQIPGCRAGERFFVVNPDGTLSPCGLIIKTFGSREEMRKNFSKNNACAFCYTSIRANTEKPIRCSISDGLKALAQGTFAR